MDTLKGSERNCVKLRGLPWSTSPEDVVSFFGDLKDDISSQGIHMVLNAGVSKRDTHTHTHTRERERETDTRLVMQL